MTNSKEYCPKCGGIGMQVYCFGDESDEEDLSDMGIGKFTCSKCLHNWEIDWVERDFEMWLEEDDELELKGEKRYA